jgi:alkylation response protein AidB-like acyl-CoA dehydrogenase
MDFSLTPDQVLIRDAVREVCARFPGQYWRDREANGEYPTQFVKEMTRLGWLSVLIPEKYGGGGQGVTEASIILEEVHRSGGNANACHAQLYTMGALARHGSEEQKRRWLPPLAAGELRLQAFGITEPDAGSDSTRIATRAERDGGDYVVTGQKTFISRAEQTDLMLLLARTGPPTAADRAAGLSLFLVDLRAAGGTVETRRIPLMFNYHTYQVFFSGLRVPDGHLIGVDAFGAANVDGSAEFLSAELTPPGQRPWFGRSRQRVRARRAGRSTRGRFRWPAPPAEWRPALRFKAASLFDAGSRARRLLLPPRPQPPETGQRTLWQRVRRRVRHRAQSSGRPSWRSRR